MFLQVMNKEEREKFMELIYKTATIDGVFAEEEKEIINNYKKELNITEISDTGSMGELINYFADKNDTLKKIVLFELIGIINADDAIEKAEKELLSDITNAFELNPDTINSINEVAGKLQKIYDEIYDVLFD